mgnify:CR=1 FL=1
MTSQQEVIDVESSRSVQPLIFYGLLLPLPPAAAASDAAAADSMVWYGMVNGRSP